MHVGLICDRDRLRLERAAIERLAIGLIDEGAAISRIYPKGFVPDRKRRRTEIGFHASVEYDPKVVRWMRGVERRATQHRLEQEPPDVFLTSGREGWKLGRWLAGIMERPLVYDIWSTAEVRALQRRETLDVCYAAVTDALADLMRRDFSNERVTCVRLGVPVPPIRDRQRATERARGIAVLGRARDLHGYRAAIDALAEVVHEDPDVHLFVELREQGGHDVWRLLQAKNLLDRVSAFGSASDLRRVLVGCDLAVIPDSYGEVRSIVLELMAAACPIVSRPDPMLDFINSQTARIVESSSVESWSSALMDAGTRPELLRDLAASGRELIQQRYRVDQRASGMYGLLERVISGPAIPFPNA